MRGTDLRTLAQVEKRTVTHIISPRHDRNRPFLHIRRPSAVHQVLVINHTGARMKKARDWNQLEGHDTPGVYYEYGQRGPENQQAAHILNTRQASNCFCSLCLGHLGWNCFEPLNTEQAAFFQQGAHSTGLRYREAVSNLEVGEHEYPKFIQRLLDINRTSQSR